MQIQAHFQPSTFIRTQRWLLILAITTGTGCQALPMEDAASLSATTEPQVTDSSQVVADFRQVDVQVEIPLVTEGLEQWQTLLQGMDDLRQHTIVGALTGAITVPGTSQTLLFLSRQAPIIRDPQAGELILLVFEEDSLRLSATLLPDKGRRPIGAIWGADGLLLPVMGTDLFHMGITSTHLTILSLALRDGHAVEVVQQFRDVFHHGCGLPHLPQEISAQRILADVVPDDDHLHFSTQTFIANCSNLDTLTPEDFRSRDGHL